MPSKKTPTPAPYYNGNSFEHYDYRHEGGGNGYQPSLDQRNYYRDQPTNMRDNVVTGVMSPVSGAGSQRARGPQLSISEHIYSVDHLVTWSIGAGENDVMTHEDGMRQLAKMDRTQGGVYSIRCTLIVSKHSVTINDASQDETEMEKFPLTNIRDPLAVVKDKRGPFSNIVIFTVLEEAGSRGGSNTSHSEMHIFRVLDRTATELADDIAEAQNQLPRSSRLREESSRPTSLYKQHDDQRHSRTESLGNLSIHNMSVQAAISKFDVSNMPQEELPSPAASGGVRKEPVRARKQFIDDDLEQKADIQDGVSLMNRCFDDIERFVLRLKQATKAFEQLHKRKSSSRRQHGDGMLTMRSRAPAPADFIEVFQKFKLCFNILARLRPYLHNPNSSELIHFLFTPLGLIVEASRDPRHDVGEITSKVVSPLLSSDAVVLLRDCLTSKEYDFWRTLGDSWSTPRDKWVGHVAMYKPRFSDGYQPPESLLESFLGNPLATRVATRANSAKEASRPVIDTERAGPSGIGRPISHDSSSSLTTPTTENRPSIPYQYEKRPDRDQLDDAASPRSARPHRDNYKNDYLKALQLRNVRICEVIQDRQQSNTKELTITKGEVVEVLDDTRNWWKCSNINGDQGYVPYTLLKTIHEPSIRNNVTDSFPPPPPPITSPPVVVAPPIEVPAPPPPPPPVVPPPPAAKPVKVERRAPKQVEPNEKKQGQRSNGFDAELKQRLSRLSMLDQENGNSDNSKRRPSVNTAQVFIDNHSNEMEIADWLVKKGFNERTQDLLAGYNGLNLFKLNPESILRALGANEGARLNSQLKLMKTTSGVGLDYSASGSSELKAILAKQKQRAGDSIRDSGVVAPAFSSSDSDGSADGGSRLQRRQLGDRKY